MILRLIRGWAEAGRFEALHAAVQAALAQAEGDGAGPLRLHVGEQAEDNRSELIIVTAWESVEHAQAGTANGLDELRLAAEAGYTDLAAAHFEIEAPIEREVPGEIVAIRLARGQFSKPGADIEMLRMLREQAPLLGGGLAEGYIGRRTVGREVEIGFVTVWRGLTDLGGLDVRFWPDYALRYDRFMIQVFRAAGAPARIG